MAGPLCAKGRKNLLIGEHRTMHFQSPVIASDWFDTPQPLPWIQKTRDNDALLDKLIKNGVSTIFLNTGELRQYYQQSFCPRFTPDELKRFETLWHHPRLQVIYQDEFGVIIYKILPDDGN